MRRFAASLLTRSVVRLRLAGVVVLLALQLSGCLTVDAVLNADGTGKMTLTYLAMEGADEAEERERLTAAGTTIESLSIAPDRKVTAVVQVKDLNAIGKLALLKGTAVTTGTDGDAKTLTITNVVKQLPKKPGDAAPGPSIRITLPGPALDANESGVVDGSTVKWSFKLLKWQEKPEWKLTARYRPADAGAPAAPKAD